jgi:hypothetical protein
MNNNQKIHLSFTSCSDCVFVTFRYKPYATFQKIVVILLKNIISTNQRHQCQTLLWIILDPFTITRPGNYHKALMIRIQTFWNSFFEYQINIIENSFYVYLT